jgi:hypothetical protein
MRTVKYFFCFCALYLLPGWQAGPGDELCGLHNLTTRDGEEINYTVFYSVAGMYVHAGSATFTNRLEKLDGKPVFHVIGIGGSNSKYDWIYKVRDLYESFIDTVTMQPLKFVRNIEEGRVKKYENVRFNRAVNTAVTDSGVFKVPACIQDVMSTVYAARNINFTRFKMGEKIPFRMFLENEVHELYIRYLGRETVKTRYGKFRAIKFKPLLVPGTIFNGGEQMTVWVSDDENRLPVRIESSILIGSIKVDMTDYKNLRYPLSSLEKQKAK